MGEVKHIGHVELHRSENMPPYGFYNNKRSVLEIGGVNVPMHELAIEVGPENNEYLMVKIPLRCLSIEVHDGQD